MSEMPIRGRMSPQAKEELYRSYHAGATIKDLSLKYGIFPERVKAIIYQKHLYWEEVYPRLGETHMRYTMELEMEKAAKEPFQDYGLDLKAMAEREKGLRVTKLAAGNVDIDKNNKKDRKEVEDFLSK